MKSSVLIVVLLSLTAQRITAVDEQGTIVYEKKRAPKLFSIPSRAAGQYVESSKTISESHMPFGDKTMDTAMTLITETDVLVTDDAKTGGSHVTATVTRMEMISETAGFTMECDTNQDKEVASPMCLSLYDSLEKAVKFDLSSDGSIMDASGPGSEIVKKAYIKKGSSPTDTSTAATLPADGNELKASWAKTSRMLQLVPSTKEVKPGDMWDSSHDLGEIGHFNGTGTLLGYRTVDERDCAVFSFVGTLQFNMDKVADALGGDDSNKGASMIASILEDVTTSDAKMESVLYYDSELGIIRWSKTHQTMVMTMPDIMGGSDTISVPSDATTITSCRIKE